MRRIVVRAALAAAFIAVAAAGPTAAEPCCWIAGTDQGSDRILVLDPAKPDWTRPEALKWAWAPTADNGFADVAEGWGLPDEARLRRDPAGRRYLLATDSYGFVGLVRYPSGRRAWAVNVRRGPNPHAAELLPGGNVAAAASTGGWVRLYAASQGPDTTTHAEYRLPGAHGVLWDPERELLWAIGDHHLVELRVGGTPAAPTLTEVSRRALPTPWGHDLQPVYGDRDRLWITSGSRVYQFVKSTGEFRTDYPHAAQADRGAVKAVGNNPRSNQVVQTVPKAGCATTWCTDTVDLLGPDATRTLPGAQFYKARWWWSPYQ